MALPTIYLLRHGETLWNSLGRFQGQLDSPLTPRGVEQADQVARLFRDALNKDNQLFQMQISPLGRVRQTAERVQAKLPLPYIEDDRLVEVTTGSWDGLTRFEIDNEFPGHLDGSTAFDWYFRAPDGESFDDACKRATSWILDVRHPTIAISHGLFGRILRGVFLGLLKQEILELPVPQDGFYRLDDGRCELITV
ncbi:histidine phosphatase family protein [Agrobacterium fabrum]|uniref:Probable phosphoglycerate mutase n=1 Tax=Agrobacterium fabrum TaxID=1176649 RepID=A0A7Z7FSH9_9HYPH|nr:histidine phosphatase family protein [Agrobacterium fabrum]UXT58884.1 histidine phosphatase family protein [Agrobacterium fabrum]WCK79527.1 phosphoglycerate mutase family protein [Agrobacterium fabrum]CUX51954.1 Phosphoglycerate mutase [Agrobacterium fabrum str. J-07]SDK50307.1 probable phosphoglycerate mutase [Agrobacterium fabrum]